MVKSVASVQEPETGKVAPEPKRPRVPITNGTGKLGMEGLPKPEVKKGRFTRCTICQRLFVAVRSDQRFCSTKCRDKYPYKQKKKAESRVCKQCGARYITSIAAKVFCSSYCKNVWHTGGVAVEEVKACAYCGMEFVTNNARRAYYCPEHAERAKVKRLRETRRAGKIELLTKDGV